MTPPRDFTPVAKILAGGHDGREVSLRGWLHRARSSGKIAFLVLRDATGIIQCTVAKGKLPDDQFAAAASALTESSVEVAGTVAVDARAPGGFEVRCSSFRLVGAAGPFPITADQSEELLLDNRHLWTRSREQGAVMKVKASLLAGARAWFAENGFFETTPPIITTNACEGGSTLFEFDYFGQRAYLSQSAQMYLEALMFNLERVYALTPSFRAEKSRTLRHLAEYWHLEGEEAWLGNEGNMKVQEELLSAMVHRAASERGDELRLLGRDPAVLKAIEPPFPRIEYSAAVEKLRGAGCEIGWGYDLGTKEEKLLSEAETRPLFVKNYPKDIKAFYMKVDPDDSRRALCADLLAPEGYGEIIGGSERETSEAILEERLKAQGTPLEPYKWYLDLRRFGSVPHSGFGMGIERVVRWVCKLDHIRDAIPFPRVMNRAYP